MIRKANLRIIGTPEGKEGERGIESLFKAIIVENSPIPGKHLDIPVHKANRTLYYINAKRPSARHSITKMAKINEKEIILKAARKKN